MAKGRSTSEQQDAIEMLLEDHKTAQKMFREFEKLERSDAEALRELVSQACVELKVHSMLEKEIFYPAVREAVQKEEDEDILNEAEVEHQTVDQLIETLEGMDPSDAMYAAHFTVLSEYVKHHVKEEEKEMFPRVKKLKDVDLEALGAEMAQRKQELMTEFGMAGEEDEESEEVEEEEEEEEGEKSGARGRGRR